MKKETVAVLITCHNRREITLACLQALDRQAIDYLVYLVDDGSTDGTSEAVKANYPQTKIIQGDGNLFWVGGMHLAFAEAMKVGHDYYLWLNDDTLLEPDALNRLLQFHQQLQQRDRAESILVGSTQDPVTKKATYGGAIRSKHWYSNKFEFVQPTQVLQECDTMYGNCVLIPRTVAEKVGNIDRVFIHTMGDLDYGLRAKQLGCYLWAVPGYIGTCSKNSVSGSWVDMQLPIYQRLQKAFQIKGFPFKSWFTFTKRHSGIFWFIYLPLPYLRAIIGYKKLSASPTFTEETKP